MNTDSGFGANGAPYEYTVAEQPSKVLLFRRVTLIAIYVLWAALWLVAGIAIGLIAPLLVFILLTLWILIFFTWRLTQVEYEYSFFAGILTVSRVLGGRSRKLLVEVPLRNLSSVYPCTEEYADRIDAFRADRAILAASSSESDALYAALWSDEENGRHSLYFEPNEKALKILRYYNASALSVAKR